jgi:predicted metal-dependent peptidase
MSAPDLGAWLDAFLRDPGFLERYPYYAAILARLVPVADPSVQRMAVSLHDRNFYLHINVDAFLAEPQYLRGVLLHEVHHLALGHLGHPKFTEADEAELMDLALEMSANEYIEEPLPNPIVWSMFAAVGIRAGQSSIERYDLLVDAHRSGALDPKPGQGPRHDHSSRADDHRYLKRRERDPGAVEHTRKLVQEAVDQVQRHEPEGDHEDPKRRLLAGKTPGRLLEELTGAVGEAAIFMDWKAALRLFIARARAPVHTWSRPSRRFPGRIGEIPGRTYSPRVIVKPHLLVAIDTSMSMSEKELSEIGRQLATLADHARITVVECDVEITRVYPFAGALGDVAGRGGTDLRPVFEPDFIATHRPQGVVYFTDGDGPFPDEAPALPVLWILTKPLDFACPFGSRALLVRKGAPPTKPTKPAKGRARREPKARS